MCIAYDMRALGKPKGHWRGRVRDAFVLEREETNAAVDKLPWVVHVVHQESVGRCTVSWVSEGPTSAEDEAGLRQTTYSLPSVPRFCLL